MGRIIAIDYGTKRVGLAVTDPLQIIATALDTVHSKDVLDYLKNYIAAEAVEAIVLGESHNLDGSDNNMSGHIRGFERTLRKTFPDIEVHLEDESFTSQMALDALIQSGTKKKQRREKTGNIDKISAVILLQSFMQRKDSY
ncbi:MAG: Holliday junction resolvase RuvX [Bernardetiaceae bacterium]|nr:Holliday junction resolvase RuvX [Bernardetiaceae bacterium]